MSASSEAFDEMCASLSLADALLMAADEANLFMLTPSAKANAHRVGAGSELVIMARKYIAEALEKADLVSFANEVTK